MADKKIRAIMIVESMGRPADYLKTSLASHMGRLKERKEVEIISEKIHEPKKMEEMKEEMYTCFSEVEIKTATMLNLVEVIFDYMPASVEIIEPEKIEFNLNESNNFVNELAGRLHKYDEITKVAQMQAQQMVNRLKMVQQLLKDNNIDVEQLLKNSKEKLQAKPESENKVEEKAVEDNKKEEKPKKESKKKKK